MTKPLDPRDLSLGTAVKVGSILVHVEEAMSTDGHNLDVHALRAERAEE